MAPAAVDIVRRKDVESSELDQISGSPGRGVRLTGKPIHEGSVLVHQSTPEGKQIRRPVIVKVYWTSFGGRYAIVCQDKLISADCGYINLTYCTVTARVVDQQTETGRRRVWTPEQRSGRTPTASYVIEITSYRNDFRKLVFSVKSRAELEQWMTALVDPERSEWGGEWPELLLASPAAILGELSPRLLKSPKQGQKQTIMSILEEEE